MIVDKGGGVSFEKSAWEFFVTGTVGINTGFCVYAFLCK